MGGPEADAGDLDQAPSFGLEAQLRDFLAHNLQTVRINGRFLHLFADEAGRSGIEYPTGVGPIDILAADDDGQLFVFELKLERGPDKALGQLTRYMGWVRAHLSPSAEVSGVIVARSIDERLRYAVAVVPHVTLLEYEVSFLMREALPIEREAH